MKSIREEWSFLSRMVKAIALQFGERCEVVLHDLSHPEAGTIVAIENGHVTGRKAGDPGTGLGIEIARGTADEKNRYNYLTQTKDGRLLRSSSVSITDEEGKEIGAFCINFDISDLVMAERALQSLTSIGVQQEVKESFVGNVNDLLDALIQEVQELIGKPVAQMGKEDKVEAIRLLDRKGAFLIKKAGEKICGYLNISKFTLYSYLEEAKQAGGGER